jgi:hypothetical protein
MSFQQVPKIGWREPFRARAHAARDFLRHHWYVPVASGCAMAILPIIFLVLFSYRSGQPLSLLAIGLTIIVGMVIAALLTVELFIPIAIRLKESGIMISRSSRLQRISYAKLLRCEITPAPYPLFRGYGATPEVLFEIFWDPRVDSEHLRIFLSAKGVQLSAAIPSPQRTLPGRVTLPLAILAAALAGTIAWGAAPLPRSSIMLIGDSEPGQRLTIHGRVTGESGQPVAGARLHIYQTDASGRYTPDKPMDEPHARLSGWVRTDKDGRFELHTIRPGGYPKAVRLGDRDRKIPAHVHIDIAADGYAPRKLQAVFSDDPLLSDPYWQDWVRTQGHPVVTVGRSAAGQVADLALSLRLASP